MLVRYVVEEMETKEAHREQRNLVRLAGSVRGE